MCNKHESIMRRIVVNVIIARLCLSLGAALNNITTTANNEPKNNQNNATKIPTS